VEAAKRIKVIVKHAQQTDRKILQFVLVERVPMMMVVENARIAKTNVRLASAQLLIAGFVRETEFSLRIVCVPNLKYPKLYFLLLLLLKNLF
jgi:hypothetical protein